MDLDARLFLKYGHRVVSQSVESVGAITLHEAQPTQNGWKAYTLRGNTWGRARLTVTYDDNSKQSISYYVIKPAAQVVADLGAFYQDKTYEAAQRVLKEETNPDIVVPADYYNEYVLLARTMQQQRVRPKGIYSVLGGAASSYKFVKEFPEAAPVARQEHLHIPSSQPDGHRLLY